MKVSVKGKDSSLYTINKGQNEILNSGWIIYVTLNYPDCVNILAKLAIG